MMISIGIDLQSIEQLGAAQGLLESGLCFTESERAHASRAASGAASSLAGIFAAKEALLKALPMRPPCYWDEIEVAHEGNGRPRFRFHGALGQWIKSMRWAVTPSISHSGGYALAVAVVDQEA